MLGRQVISLPDVSALDFWCFDQFRNLLQKARDDTTLAAQLDKDKTVFFVYFLATDMAGHSHRPHSKVTLLVSRDVHDTYS